MSTATKQNGQAAGRREEKTEAKTGLVWFPLGQIRPSPENEQLYRPINAQDEDILELARSIREHGVKEPLVVTRDGYILSGHRRYAACKRLGLTRVPCRVEPIWHHDPQFLTLLREFNQQRVKTFDEVLREQVIDLNPEDSAPAYEALIEHRLAAAAVSGDFIKIEGVKKRAKISRAKWPMLEAVKRIVLEQRAYWPLSDRSIHYGLASANPPPLRHASKPGARYANNKDCYKDVCDLLTRARLEGRIPFAAIADPTRTMTTWDAVRHVGDFLKAQLDDFLDGYWRDLQQSQPNHIEIVGEKNTIAGSIHPVAMKYCIPYTLGRGYCSLDPRYKMVQRFKRSGKARLIILVLCDFDPEGDDIPHSFARSLRDDFGVRNVVARKVCLTHEQVLERDLPRTFDIKKSSSRYRKFAAKYGDRVHELEAIPTAEQARLLEQAIDEVMDIDAFNKELDQEREDATKLERLRKQVAPMLTKALK